MKKKYGFTLAEVLITLVIIGVVAALAAPALNGAVQKSKVGPTLRKFVTTMENANEHIMQDAEADTISDIAGTDDRVNEYTKLLLKYVKGSVVAEDLRSLDSQFDGRYKNTLVFDNSGKKASDGYTSLPDASEDGYPKVFKFADGSSMFFCTGMPSEDSVNENVSYKGRAGYFIYDINGYDVAPNKAGKDIFYFIMDNNGSVIPYGGQTYKQAYNDNDKLLWKDGDNKCSEDTVNDGFTCSGSVADNGWKVIYKY